MGKMIAYCGLDCAECGAYKATVANDDELRKQTAEEWSKEFNANVNPSDINCLGCQSDVLFSHCKVCDIRTCGEGKKVDNCGACSEYGCEKISKFTEAVPSAKANLEEAKNN